MRVPAEQRAAARALIAEARALRADAGDGRAAAPRTERALRLLLTAAGRATGGDALSDLEAIRRGAHHAAATLDALDALDDRRLAELLTPLISDGPALSASDARADDRLDRLRALCDWLEALLDVRSDRERRLLRWLRWALLALALCAAGRARLGDHNLARGKEVTASSICSSTPPAPPGQQRLHRLVDGTRLERNIAGVEWGHGTYAMCTNNEVHPWITVDLGAPRTIDEVVVYNRSDCCWGVDDTPIDLQLSADNQTFETVATRHNPFNDDFPWRQTVRGRRARFVRIINPAEQPKNMVFSEIEVYGR